MIYLKLLTLTLIVALSFAPGSAQQSSASENAQTAGPALREKAFALLESLASQISSLQSAENRARLGSNIAESLWNYDEKRARVLLVSVEEDIKAGLQEQEGDDRTDVLGRMAFLQLRTETVERIAKHDADLALAFLKATELTSDKAPSYGEAERERALELRLARNIAAGSPDLAVKLGRQGYSRRYLKICGRWRDHERWAILAEDWKTNSMQRR